MNQEACFADTKEYRGCGITAASYRRSSGDWIPEACFWLDTENGRRRLWINSFAHCIGVQEHVFSSKIEADHCAFRMAQLLIDRAKPALKASWPWNVTTPTHSLRKMLSFVRRPLSVINRISESKRRT